jgi:tetraacyldisaccharide 4'-kinase
MFTTPNFWKRKGFLSYLLLPIAKIYYAISYLNQKFKITKKVPRPVICVGNVVLGGAGKTPVVIAISKILKNLGYQPHIISRGYGAVIRQVTKVDSTKHDYLNVGDEPLLLSKNAPTWVSTDRRQSIDSAIKDGANILILDDGLQNKSIYKDLNILVIDSLQGLGNSLLFPSGPLREPLNQALKNSHLIVIVGDHEVDIQTNIPKVRAKFDIISDIPHQSVVAFAGLGYPEKFLYTLEHHGFRVFEFLKYPDHHPYTIPQIKKLLKIAESYGARLMTTEKDFTRIPEKYQKDVLFLKVELCFDDPIFIEKILKNHLS